MKPRTLAPARPVWVDAAVGSRDLVDPLKALGLPAELVHLDSADVAFEGRGPQGVPLKIGVELKRISELVQSLQTGRLPLEQLPKMLQAYHESWILVEGMWRESEAGMEEPRGRRLWKPLYTRMSANEFEKRMLTLELEGNEGERRPHVRYVNTRAATLQFLCALYRWHTDKDSDQHTSRLGVYQPPTFFELSIFRQMVSRLPHVGIKRSKEVEDYFEGSLQRMALSELVEWIALLGETHGQAAYAALPRRKDKHHG